MFRGKDAEPCTDETEAELDGSSLPLTALILYHTLLTWFVSMCLNCKMQGQELPSTSVIFFLPLKQKTHTFQTKSRAEIDFHSVNWEKQNCSGEEGLEGFGSPIDVLSSCRPFFPMARLSQLQP